MQDLPATPAERAVFRYDGVAVGVSAAPADLEWLSEILGPAFSIGGGTAETRVEVRFAFDAERYAEIERRGPATPPRAVAGLILDDSTEVFTGWNGAPAARVGPGDAGAVVTTHDPHFPVAYEVAPGRVRITAGPEPISRVCLMRVVREYVMDACLRRGNVFLHAAAICVEGFAIVLAGAKRSGKTTTLSWSLDLLEHAQLIANDRVRVQDTPSGAEVRAMPSIVSYRPEVFDLLPELGAAIRSDRSRCFLGRREVEQRPDLTPLEPFGTGDYGLTPCRLAELLGRKSVACAPAGALVFPEIVHDEGGIRVEPLDPADAAARIDDVLFSARNLGRPSELFASPEAGPFPSGSELRERARRFGERVPAYVWKLGRRAPQDASTLGRFVRDVAAR